MKTTSPPKDGLQTDLPILFLTPSTEPAQIKQQLLQFITFNLPVSLGISLILALFVPQYNLWQMGMAIAMAQILMLILVYTGYAQVAVYVLPLALFVISVVGARMTNDHQGLFLGFLGLTVLVTAALLGSRWTAIMVMACTLASAYLFWDAPGAVPAPPLVSFILGAFQLLTFGLVGHYTMRKLVISYWQSQVDNQTLLQMQQQWRHSEQTKSAILQSIPDMMAVINAQGVYIDYQALTYFREEDPPESVIGLTVQDKLPPFLVEQRMNHIHQALATRQVITYEETQSVRKQPHFFSTRIMAINDELVLVMMRDITEEKRQEAANLAAQKSESVGLLAGGVAHDFNNLLTGMMAQTSLALAKLGDNDPAAKHIRKANIAAERAADLTRQLLAYAGQGHIQTEQLDFNAVIQENLSLIRASLPPHVNLKYKLTRRPIPVRADRGHLHQVVMNLVINAAEAIQEGYGVIKLTTQLLNAPQIPTDLYVVDHRDPAYTGRYVSLEVEDTGVGIGAETLARIFDPFFSKKRDGRGLGLSASLGIIRRYQGLILVDSQPSVGTRFMVLWPHDEGMAMPEAET